MADRRHKLLFDAITAIEAARGFVAGVTLERYEAELMRRSATERQLEILGEACARLARGDPQGVDAVPAVRLAVALRNRIIHGYDAVDDETVFRNCRRRHAWARGRFARLADPSGRLGLKHLPAIAPAGISAA